MLTFMSGCLAGRPFRDQVEAAAVAGFKAITIWPNVLRYSLRKQGLTLKDMRALLDDNGLVLADVEGCVDWRPVSPGQPSRHAYGLTRDDYFEACAALGARNLGAIHPAGVALDMAEATEAFAMLCDDAAAFGLNVALEFMAFSALSDAGTAMAIVRGADCNNGGLVIDSWHHVRGAGRGDAALLREIPRDRIFTLQLSDGPARSDLPLEEETMYHRLLPGDGEMDLRSFVAIMRDKGVTGFYGPEVYRPSFQNRPTIDIMCELVAATERVEPEGWTAGEMMER